MWGGGGQSKEWTGQRWGRCRFTERTEQRVWGGGGGTYQERTGQCGENLGLVRKVGWPVFKTVKQKERSFVA